ncbi:MAG: PqqD family protein [Flavobacteriales bacterium]|nr:PqqD family protein [Flavobacteriales bacterium]
MKLKKDIAISDSGFLFNPSSGDSYTANPIATEILKYMQSGFSNEQIIVSIMESYEVERSTIEKDLFDLESMLSNYKLTR